MRPGCEMRSPTSSGSSRLLPEFDPSSNGHRRSRSSSRDPAARGRGVVLVATVCATSGAGLVVGFIAGGLIAGLFGLRGQPFFAAVAVASAVTAGVGMWLGIRFASRLGGGPEPPPRARRWSTAGGFLGLIAAVALATTNLGPFAPIIVILLPGAGALAGEVLALRRK